MRVVMIRQVSIACCSLLAICCGLSDPSVKQLDMPIGDYMLVVNPVACAAGDIRPGVGIVVTLAHEGRDWVARSESALDGTVEFRFHEVPDTRVAGVPVAGTLVGSGADHRPFASSGARVGFAGVVSGSAASVSAQTSPNLPNEIGGTATGQIVFDDDARGLLTCARADIALRLPVPCEVDAAVPCN